MRACTAAGMWIAAATMMALIGGVVMAADDSAGAPDAKAAAPEAAKSPYAQWTNGPSADPNWFPIGVWAQNPRRAARYKAIGVNFFLSLHGGPTEEQLADLKAAGMRAICSQNEVGLAHKDDPTIIGWMHGDEPDNFTKNDEGKWVPKAKPDKIIADYQRIRRNDPTRPVLLNLGQGVANDGWKGGWAKAKDYVELVKGCDIVSYDIYPVCSTRAETAGKLEMIPLGVERLRKYGRDRKTVWFITEASHIQNAERMASPAEMRSEVWMALIRGATGIIYFCHQWKPVKDFAFPLNDPATRQAVTDINKQITALAPVLNSPTVMENAATATSSKPAVPIDVMQKNHGGATYVFAAALRGDPTKATFQLGGLPAAATAEVLGEDRTIDAKAGKFADDFGPYAVHLYKTAKR